MKLFQRFRGGLFGKYVAYFVGFAVFVLAMNVALDLWFIYRETTNAVVKLEWEKAEASAQRIEQLFSEIERQIAWTTRASANLEQRRSDYVLLLQQVPAIDEIMQIDGNGRELLRITRFSTEAIAGTDYSQDPRFTQALAKRVWISPVYFRNQVEPYVSIAMAHSGAYAGVTVAEVDLRFLRDAISGIQVGAEGYAYVIGSDGRLLAQSGQTQIPRGTEMSGLSQVGAILAAGEDSSGLWGFGRNLADQSVLAAAVAIPRFNWFVVVEQPLSEAFKPLYALLWRIGWLLLACTALAALSGVALAQRMVVPIRALHSGAARLGASEFGTRIEVDTGDEIEDLANEFNSMAAKLKESYSRLEQTVEERTRDLARSVRELKALEEIGRTVASSLDLNAVLATVVDRAVELARADAGLIYGYDKARQAFHLTEARGLDPALVAEATGLDIPLDSALGRAAAAREPINISDLADVERQRTGDLLLAAGYHSVLALPLLGPEDILGALAVLRRDAADFAPNTVNLMQTFADQSVIAMHNAELFREVEERGRQLQIANEHKSQFFANMSHELRTPLNAVLGYAELLVDGLYGTLPEKAVEVLERVQANGHHLLGLINDVLDLSKIEAGQLTLSMGDYSMRSVIDSVMASTESLAKAKGLALSAEIAEDLPIGYGDERRLAQVFLNIVGNAIKFTEKGSVVISAKSDSAKSDSAKSDSAKSDSAKSDSGIFDVAVRDTGPGIAPQDQARIFDEFQQVDASNTRQKGGTGLGLAIARRLAEMHGGTISLMSELGAGSEFRVILPVRAVKPAKGDAPP